MSLFKKQKAFCMICGTPFLSDYSRMKNGSICSRECLQEWDWRHTLCIMGKDYYLDPKLEQKLEDVETK